jgi:hypothetical protein
MNSEWSEMLSNAADHIVSAAGVGAGLLVAFVVLVFVGLPRNARRRSHRHRRR